MVCDHTLSFRVIIAHFVTPGTLLLHIRVDKVDGQCANLTMCYKGGIVEEPCTIPLGCPACVTFRNSGCFELVDNKCNFGVDCTEAWANLGTPKDSSNLSTVIPTPVAAPPTIPTTPSSTTHGTVPLATTLKPPITAPSGTTTPSSNSVSVPSDTSNNGTTPAKSSTKHKSEITTVFAILGAAIGVIAVGIIFLILVRRTGVHGDMDDLVTTPPMSKSGHGTQYAKSAPSGSSVPPLSHGTHKIARPVIVGQHLSHPRAFEL